MIFPIDNKDKVLSSPSKEEEIVLFKVRSNGREWEVDNIILVQKDTGFVAYIYDKKEVKEEGKEEEGRKEVGLKEAKEGHNTITCIIPSLSSLYDWCYLIFHKPPRFTISDKAIPNDCC